MGNDNWAGEPDDDGAGNDDGAGGADDDDQGEETLPEFQKSNCNASKTYPSI